MILLFFPQKKISQVPVKQIQEVLIERFMARGMPAWIKVDNGRPFADPKGENIPALALWLIAMGVKVIWNRPRVPQDNAKVERSQGVLANWVEPHKCHDTSDLQRKLLKETYFHNCCFPVSRLNGKTRLEAYPELKQHSGRVYDPRKFDLSKALNFLEKGYWERNVSLVGQVSIFGQRIQAGTRYRNQQVSIKMDAKKNAWLLFSKDSEPIKAVPTKITEEALWNLDLS